MSNFDVRYYRDGKDVTSEYIKDTKNKENEKAYKIFLLLENELEQDLIKSKECHECKVHSYCKTLLNKLRRKYKRLIEE